MWNPGIEDKLICRLWGAGERNGEIRGCREASLRKRESKFWVQTKLIREREKQVMKQATEAGRPLKQGKCYLGSQAAEEGSQPRVQAA